MAGKHHKPVTGDGKTRSMPKLTKNQVTVKSPGGATLWGQTVRLFTGKRKG